MKSELMAKVTRLAYTSKLKIKKHSPEILLTVGIIGTITSTVMACKRTLKVNDILKEKKDNCDAVHKCLEEKRDDYTQQDANKDLTVIYAQTGIKLVKLYAPAIMVGALSIGSIISGHKILKKRNVALAAAYAIIDKSFKRYRAGVIEEFGQGVDQQLRFGIKSKEIEVKDKNGKVKKEVVSEIEDENFVYSDYARFFDAASNSFEKDPEYNLMFLRRQQDYANDLLKSRGHLFLNEVYDLLDIPRTKAGQIVGWIYDPKNNTKGDNYVDFGIYKNNSAHRRFVNGLEYNILLDFNVDGVIYDLI